MKRNQKVLNTGTPGTEVAKGEVLHKKQEDQGKFYTLSQCQYGSLGKRQVGSPGKKNSSLRKLN